MNNLFATTIARIGDMKKECPKCATWRVKTGKSFALVCSKVNLSFVPKSGR